MFRVIGTRGFLNAKSSFPGEFEGLSLQVPTFHESKRRLGVGVPKDSFLDPGSKRSKIAIISLSGQLFPTSWILPFQVIETWTDWSPELTLKTPLWDVVMFRLIPRLATPQLGNCVVPGTCCHWSGKGCGYTLPKFNMEPENGTLE